MRVLSGGMLARSSTYSFTIEVYTMRIHADWSSNTTGNPAGKALAIHQAVVRKSKWNWLALAALCLFTGCALVVAPLFGATFLPPVTSPTGFWNATPTLSNGGVIDFPSSAYLGIRMSAVSWGHAIESTTRGTYDWTGVDAYTNVGGNFLYTFLWVPTWANAVPTPSSNNVSGFSVASGVITFTASNTLIPGNKVTLTALSTSCLNAVYTVLGDTNAPTSTTFQADVPGGCTPGASSGGKYSFAGSGYQAPRDLNVSALCQGVLSTTTTTDCQYKEFVTAFMQHICPTNTTCKIRNFESWNEFSSNGYWDDKYQNLATMSEDAARIVAAYCSNCQFGAGSVSAGGVGYNDSEVNTRTGSPNKHYTYYNDALAQLLLDWKADKAADNTIPAPVFISWHPYSAAYETSSTQALTPQPMPEYNYSGDGSGTVHGGNIGDSACTIANESNITNKYCVDSVVTQAANIGGMTKVSTYGVNGAAFWATEGGFTALASLTNTDNNDTDSNNPKAICTGAYSPDCTADVLRSAYVARWLILLRAAGVGRAYWYSWDQPCFGTLFGMDYTTGHPSADCNATYNGGTPYPTGTTDLYTLYDTETRAGKSWDQVQLWLNGASEPSGCTENTSTHIYSCTTTRTSPAGYVGLMVWYTTWLGTTSYTPPAGYTQYRTLTNATPVPYTSGSVTLGAEPIIFEKKT